MLALLSPLSRRPGIAPPERASELREVDDFLGDNSVRLYRGRYVALATSGSTGRRGVFLFNEKEWLTAVASIARADRMGWHSGESVPAGAHRDGHIDGSIALFGTGCGRRLDLSRSGRM